MRQTQWSIADKIALGLDVGTKSKVSFLFLTQSSVQQGTLSLNDWQ